MASVTIRKLSQETKGLLTQRAARNQQSLEEELRQILDAAALAEAGSADAQEPFGDWLVQISRPGFDDYAQILEAVVGDRKKPDRPFPDFA